MIITLYRRHSADCDHKNDPKYKRCHCPVWFQTNEDGKQHRWTSKERSWERAERKARELEQSAISGEDIHNGHNKILTDVIELFLTDKEKGSDPVAPDTLYRHKAVLDLLTAFCAARGITHIKNIRLADIVEWQYTWTLKSPAAKRGRQEKIRNFFRFCLNHEYIVKNPIAAWKSVPLPKVTDQAVRPFKKGEYEKVLATVAETPMTPENKLRVRTCMRLQRESGLSLVDAVCLAKGELIKDGDKFRVVTERQKTGISVNVPITTELGQELLTVKNGNPLYFFWSGNTLPEDAPSYFQKLYRRVFKKAGMKHSSHDFRHSYAVSFLETGGDIRLLSKALGHSSIDITEKFYAKFSPKQQELLDVAAEKALQAPF